MTSSDWLAKLHSLVDVYAVARVVPLGAAINADAATAGAWANIAQHTAEHPSMEREKAPAPNPNRGGGSGEQ